MAGSFSIETLNVKGMMRSNIARGVADAGISSFLHKLKYKNRWAGRQIYQHPAFDRSTGCCPDCMTAGPKLPRSAQSWTCSICGKKHLRDVAAGRYLDKVGQQMPEPGLVLPAPKRGSARVGKAKAARSGPPTNVPSSKMHDTRALMG